MKLTVWQQFSSNHSNGFTLVGVFPSAAKAQKAYTRIDKLLKAIDLWREKFPDDYRYEHLSRPEQKVAAKYNIHWSEPTENVGVRQYQTVVEIEASADSWTRRAPYEQLLQKFGAHVAGWDNQEQGDELSEASIFRAQITAKAKNEDDATALVLRLQEKLRDLNVKEFNIFSKASVSSNGAAILLQNLSVRRIQFFEEIIGELEAMCSEVRYELRKAELNEGEM
jgi:hypothetical protein